MNESTTASIERYWYPACTSQELGAEQPIGIELFGRSVVMWRSTEAVHAWRDYCNLAPYSGV